VKAAWHLTPNMIRVTLTGARLRQIDPDCAGANFKIFLPETDQTESGFLRQLSDGPRPSVRTYTVRHASPEDQEIDVDFVDHGDAGPASAWARRAAKTGRGFCGFAGPGSVKVTSFHADAYLLAADMSALPVVAATLEAMPRDATGVACIEITSGADQQIIEAPSGIDLNWLVHAEPSKPSAAVPDLVRSSHWPAGRV
jgi:NADPH-dependent ferric siderophore reductase